MAAKNLHLLQMKCFFKKAEYSMIWLSIFDDLHFHNQVMFFNQTNYAMVDTDEKRVAACIIYFYLWLR